MMSRYIFVIALSSILTFPANGQIAVVPNGMLQNSSQTNSGRISVALDKTPLPDAIWTVVRSAGTNATFDRNALPAKLVTYKAENVTPETALIAVLSGTGLNVNRLASGTFVITTSSKAKRVQGVIAGRITDAKTGKGISGATVSLSAETRPVTTDEDGSYRIANVPAGTYSLTVRMVGYAKQVRSITIGEGATVTADFKLDPTANVLDQVVVTGTVAATELKAVPNAMTIITAKQIEERGITRLEQLFRGDVPGLFAVNVRSGPTNDNGQVALFSRGATAMNNTGTQGSTGISLLGPLTNNMKMYVDGVQLSDSSLKFLGQIDPKSIERIEILAGPQASTIYGAGAINGVMQIFTKRGNTRRPKFVLSFQSGMSESNYRKGLELNTYVTNLSLSGLEGRISYRIGTSWNHDGNWLQGQQTNTFSSSGGANISISSKITGDASARWTRRYGLMKGNPYGATTPLGSLVANGVQTLGFNSAPRVETTFNGSQGGGLTLNYRQFPWWSHSVTLGFDGNSYGEINPAPRYSNPGDTSSLFFIRPGHNMSQAYSSTMQLPLLSLASLNLTFGGDHSRSDMNNLMLGGNRLTGRIFTVSNAFGNSDNFVQSKPNKHSGAYVNGIFGIKDALFFTYGVRADWDPAYGAAADVKPSKYGATFNHEFGSITAKLRGSYGKSLRAPSRYLTKGQLVNPTDEFTILEFGNIYVSLPNPDLVPEDQQGGEGGMDLYFGNRGSLSVTRYNQTVDNLIETFFADSVRSLRTTQDYYATVFNFIASCDLLESFDIPCGYTYRLQQQSLNIGSIRNQGWELQGTMNLGPIRTHGTYSWTKSRVIGINPRYRTLLPNYPGANFKVGAPFQYMPEHTWGFGMAYDYSRGMVSLDVNGHGTKLLPINNTYLGITTSSNNRFTYTRERMAIPDGVASLAVPGYSMANLNAHHRFASRMDATLNVTNLTNYYGNDYKASFPTVGRQTRLGLQWQW